MTQMRSIIDDALSAVLLWILMCIDHKLPYIQHPGVGLASQCYVWEEVAGDD